MREALDGSAPSAPAPAPDPPREVAAAEVPMRWVVVPGGSSGHPRRIRVPVEPAPTEPAPAEPELVASELVASRPEPVPIP